MMPRNRRQYQQRSLLSKAVEIYQPRLSRDWLAQYWGAIPILIVLLPQTGFTLKGGGPVTVRNDWPSLRILVGRPLKSASSTEPLRADLRRTALPEAPSKAERVLLTLSS